MINGKTSSFFWKYRKVVKCLNKLTTKKLKASVSVTLELFNYEDFVGLLIVPV